MVSTESPSPAAGPEGPFNWSCNKHPYSTYATSFHSCNESNYPLPGAVYLMTNMSLLAGDPVQWKGLNGGLLCSSNGFSCHDWPQHTGGHPYFRFCLITAPFMNLAVLNVKLYAIPLFTVLFWFTFSVSGAPPGPKFLHFHAFFGKNWSNNRLAPPFGVSAPSSGKSWIFRCLSVSWCVFSVLFWWVDSSRPLYHTGVLPGLSFTEITVTWSSLREALQHGESVTDRDCPNKRFYCNKFWVSHIKGFLPKRVSKSTPPIKTCLSFKHELCKIKVKYENISLQIELFCILWNPIVTTSVVRFTFKR